MQIHRLHGRRHGDHPLRAPAVDLQQTALRQRLPCVPFVAEALLSVALPHVNVSAPGLREGFPTDPTVMRLLPRMNEHVFPETRVLGKGATTAISFTQKRLLPCVDAPVVLEVPGGGELLPTVLLFADEWLVSVVRPHVNLEPLQDVEALSTALSPAPEHAVVPVSFEVVFEMCGPDEGPAAAFERAVQDGLGDGAVAPGRGALSPVSGI